MTAFKKINIILLGFILVMISSCSNELTMFLPEGPKGADGLSAYEVWVQSVKDGTLEWDKERTDITNFYLYLKGKDGKDGTNGVNGKSAYQLWIEQVTNGIQNPHNKSEVWDKSKTSTQDFWYFLTGADGQDGSTPTIGDNGNWVIDGKDTGLSSKGKDGIDGANGSNGLNGSIVTIGSNGNWFIDGKDTGKTSKGTNGIDGKNSVVIIGDNGNWYIDGKDTGKTSKGKDGANGVDGKSSVVTIGSNGNWHIDGKDTGLTSKGKDGVNGIDGKNSVVTIGDNGNWVINGQDTNKPSKGQDGKDGTNGTDGKDGAAGSMVLIGDNGNWFIDGKDTGKPAFGKDGKDGVDGTPGKDGTNGLSAYDLWVAEVSKGIDDPHNPGKQWDKSKTTTQDFWSFLRGADGKDGNDGKDGTVGGETGQPGADIKIVAGMPNVIPQYVNQAYNEFVRWEDGGVTYIVYDDAGTIAKGAKVKGLPGVLDQNKIYTADNKGAFIVPKEDLPLDLAETLRKGATASVEYIKSTGGTVTETSAPNTYVPNRMQVRMTLRKVPVLETTYLRVYPLVERRTSNSGEWEVIPSYLGSVNQIVRAYEATDIDNPLVYSDGATDYTEANTKMDITSTDASVRINRLRKPATYYPNPQNKWDGRDQFFTLLVESYYGEKPQAKAVIKMAPIQAVPMIKNIKATNYNTSMDIFAKIEGEFDIAGANIETNLFFKKNYKVEVLTLGGVTFDFYSPEKEDASVYNIAEQMTIRFSVGGNNAYYNKSSITTPTFLATTPYYNSSIILETTGIFFYQINTIGYLRTGTAGDMNTLKVVKRNDANYVFTDIPVAYQAQ